MFTLEPGPGGMAVLRMDDGKVNAIGPAFLEGFERAWADAAEARAVVLAGNPRAFSAGLDLKALPGMGRQELAGFVQRFVRLLGTLAAHPKPMVAAVDGPALAGGAILALCADMRLVSPEARLGLTEMAVGIPFPPAVLALVQGALPPQELGPAVLQGAIREGEACVPRGWAHGCVPRELLLEEARKLAAQLAAGSPRAYAMAKAELRQGFLRAAEGFGESEARAYVEALAAPDTLAAMGRYLEGLAAKRRAPEAVGPGTPKG